MDAYEAFSRSKDRRIAKLAYVDSLLARLSEPDDAQGTLDPPEIKDKVALVFADLMAFRNPILSSRCELGPKVCEVGWNHSFETVRKQHLGNQNAESCVRLLVCASNGEIEHERHHCGG